MTGDVYIDEWFALQRYEIAFRSLLRVDGWDSAAANEALAKLHAAWDVAADAQSKVFAFETERWLQSGGDGSNGI